MSKRISVSAFIGKITKSKCSVTKEGARTVASAAVAAVGIAFAFAGIIWLHEYIGYWSWACLPVGFIIFVLAAYWNFGFEEE